jgi:hypothetical protein
MPRRPPQVALATLLALALASPLGAGCARPYKGPKALAGIGAGLLATSATLWAIGERRDRDTLTRVGAAGSAAGAVAALAAGGWLAFAAACKADPDCPDDEVCREIPAPPGREPYRQCTRR